MSPAEMQVFYRVSGRKHRGSIRKRIGDTVFPAENIRIPADQERRKRQEGASIEFPPDKYRGSIRPLSGFHTKALGVPSELVSGIQQIRYRGSTR